MTAIDQPVEGPAKPRSHPSVAARRASRGGPLAALAVGVAGVGLVAIRNPNVPASYGLCPFKAITGWDCPFCGGLRGTYSLLHGHLMTALDHNILLPLMFVAVSLGGWQWWRRANGQPTTKWVTSRITVGALAGVLAVFWVLRNLPGFEYLRSAA